MILPAMLVLIALIIYPLFYSLSKSFTDYNLGMPGQQFIGLENYKNALTDPTLRNSFFVSLKYTFFAVTTELILGFGAALLLRHRFRGAALITVLLLLPMMVTPVVVGIIWLLMFQPDFSTINGFLLYLGIEGPIWLQSPATAMFAVVITAV